MQHIQAEIINKIFKHLILNILLTYNPREFPWYLGQICASWRTEFTSATWIWRKFMINVDQTIECDLDNAAHLVKLCIRRSRNRPLFFSFRYNPNAPQLRREQYANQMLSDLIVESQRWEEVYIGAGLLPLEAFSLPHLLSNPFPLLRLMVLQTFGVSWDKSKSHELFLRAPSLTQVEVDRFPTYDFDWSRLTVLILHSASSVADVLLVVRRLRCIEKPQVGIYFGQGDEEQDAMITLPTLKALSCPGHVLRHLRAPALEELRMNVQNFLPLPDGAISFFRASSGTITRLILGNLSCISSDPKRILQELPNVTRLCLDVNLNLSDVLPLNLEEGIQILPKLELLTVARYLKRCDALETLFAIVASRTSKPSSFEWPYGVEKLKELRMMSYENLDTSHLRLLCEERKVKYLDFEQLKRAGHRWCTEVDVNSVWYF